MIVGSIDLHQAETSRQRFIFGDVFLVLGHRGRADDAHLAAGQRRLEHVRGVGRSAQRRARADDRVRFVDEENQVVALFNFVDDSLDSLFKHAAQHRAGDDAAHLQLHDVRAAQTRRNFFRLQLDQPRQSFDHRSLADAGFANQHRRICAFAMAKNLDDLLNLFFAADGRRNLVGASQPVERNAEVFQIRRQLKFLAILLFFLFSFLNLSSERFPATASGFAPIVFNTSTKRLS